MISFIRRGILFRQNRSQWLLFHNDFMSVLPDLFGCLSKAQNHRRLHHLSDALIRFALRVRIKEGEIGS